MKEIDSGSLRRTFDSPALCTLLVGGLYFAFIIVRLILNGFDPSYSVTAGDVWCDPEKVPSSLTVMSNSAGYDGQFNYRLALNPFTNSETEHGITLDIPSYRHQRILYPLIVWFLSMGSPFLTSIMLIFVNYAALCAMAWIGCSIARSLDRPAIWGILFPFYPGFLLSLARDLTEILAAFLLLAAFLMIRREKHSLATVLLSLAVLSRQSPIVVSFAAMIVFFSSFFVADRTPRIKWHFFLFPAIIYFTAGFFISYNWHESFSPGGHRQFVFPFFGFIQHVVLLAKGKVTFSRAWIPEVCLLGVFTLAVITSFRSSKANPFEKVSFLLFFFLMSMMPHQIWREDWGFLRIFSEFYILGAIILLGADTKFKLHIFSAWFLLWIAFFFLRM